MSNSFSLKKFLKRLFILILIIIGLIALLIGFVLLKAEFEYKQARKKSKEESQSCNTSLYTQDQAYFKFKNFEDSEINQIRFQLLRNNSCVRDTAISGSKNIDYLIQIPFKKYLKSDTLLITVNNNLNYYISDYEYVSYVNPGVFGPKGTTGCISYSSKINNNTSLEINKFHSKLDSEKKEGPLRISNESIQYKELIKNYTISEDSLVSTKKDIHKKYDFSYVGSNVGLEINGDRSYYIFSYRNPENGKYDGYGTLVVKINTETGEYTNPIKNYPVENDY